MDELIPDDQQEQSEKPEQKKPIPLNVSGVAYVTTSDTIRYCTTGSGLPLPKDFKEWHKPPRQTASFLN